MGFLAENYTHETDIIVDIVKDFFTKKVFNNLNWENTSKAIQIQYY